MEELNDISATIFEILNRLNPRLDRIIEVFSHPQRFLIEIFVVLLKIIQLLSLETLLRSKLVKSVKTTGRK